MQDRLYRALLRLLPREVRDAYAHDMEVTLRTERRHATGSRAGFMAFWLATMADVIRTSSGYHWDILRRDIRYSWRVLAAATVACAIPARRAARVDLAEVLRGE